MVEETKLLSASDDGQTEIEIEILSDIKVGQEIRPVGFDVKNGEKVLPIGTSLTASDIGNYLTFNNQTNNLFTQLKSTPRWDQQWLIVVLVNEYLIMILNNNSSNQFYFIILYLFIINHALLKAVFPYIR